MLGFPLFLAFPFHRSKLWIILDVARVQAQTGVILINFKPRNAIARERGHIYSHG
jgi:hypothetical protein